MVKKIQLIIFSAILFEIFLGGGGQLIAIDAISLRMIFFAIAVLMGLYAIFFKRDNNVIIWIPYILIYFFLIYWGFFVGSLSGYNGSDIFQEIKPLLYFFIIIYFSAEIKSINHVLLIVKIIKISSFIMAVFYVMIQMLFYFGIVDDAYFYALVEPSGEFFFRGDRYFFYKGFLYICIGSIFWFIEEGILAKIIFSFLFVAIALTQTRGFIIALCIVLTLIIIERNKLSGILAKLFLAVLLSIPVYTFFVGNDTLSVAREVSNDVRLEDINFIYDNVSFISIIFGKGFGAYINGRLNIEINYLWIFYKIGLLGLAFFGFLFLKIFSDYLKVRSIDYKLTAGFFFGVLFVYLETASNPFLTNPIGMSFVLIAMIVLNKFVLFKKNKKYF